MKQPRKKFAVTLFQQNIYVFGGLTDHFNQKENLNTFERYSIF